MKMFVMNNQNLLHKQFFGQKKEFGVKYLQIRFGQQEDNIQHLILLSKKIDQINILLRILYTNIESCQHRCFIAQLQEERRVQGYSERRNSRVSTQHDTMNIFCHKFKSSQMPIQDLFSCKTIYLHIRSKETQANLRHRRIASIRWLQYSPNLNIIEHV